MAKTQRCQVCSDQGMVNELFADEVCKACGRCEEHCTAPHQLTYAADARIGDGRPHPKAGTVERLTKFTPGPKDPDRA